MVILPSWPGPFASWLDQSLGQKGKGQKHKAKRRNPMQLMKLKFQNNILLHLWVIQQKCTAGSKDWMPQGAKVASLKKFHLHVIGSFTVLTPLRWQLFIMVWIISCWLVELRNLLKDLMRWAISKLPWREYPNPRNRWYENRIVVLLTRVKLFSRTEVVIVSY